MSQDTKNIKILFTAPLALHDTSSGAAIQVRLFLEGITKYNFSVKALCALNFDATSGSEVLWKKLSSYDNQKIKWFAFDENHVNYTYYKTYSNKLSHMTRNEEAIFFAKFLQQINSEQPDILCLYGGAPLEIALIAEAKKRNIKICFFLFNGHYLDFDFSSIDKILTDSKATALYYKEKSQIHIDSTGIFLDENKVLAHDKKEKKYITFVNPVPEKGLTIFIRLALMAKSRQKDWAFLVLENRATWENTLKNYNLSPHIFTNVFVSKHRADIKTVFAQTKLLLAPSLWYESYGRVAAEAILNGIPVLASQSGGLIEAVNNGGICLELPEKCFDNYNYLPNEQELEAWFSALESILDESAYEDWCKKAKESSKVHNLERNIERSANILAELLK